MPCPGCGGPRPASQKNERVTGRWMKVQGFKMQAHVSCSGVVIDIAAFKVGKSVDIDATALRAARAKSNSIVAMDVTHGFNSRESSPPATHKYGDGQQTSGPMERYTACGFDSCWKAHLLPRKVTHVATVSKPVGRSANQWDGQQTSGAMDESPGKVQRCKHT